MSNIAVAIDGPAGAGKSSISKTVAKELGYIYIDTGAMYRTVALYAIKNNIDTKNDTSNLISKLDDIEINIKYVDGLQRMYLDGEDVTDMIRTEEVSLGASNVAVIPEVREKLVEMQQRMAVSDNVIMDGRDICTHVLPNAKVKIFLTASTETRAKRRYKELIEKGSKCTFEEVKQEIEYRDDNDSKRAVSPLVKADEAVLVDTSDLTFEQSVEKIKSLIMQ